MVLKWYMFHPYRFLNDIFYRFHISFGYFQYKTRDLHRDDGCWAANSPEWRDINRAIGVHTNRIRFLWYLKPVKGKMTALPRGFPKWFLDFEPQLWNDHF